MKEPVMGARRIRREQRQLDMRESRQRNGLLKAKERVRRVHCMLDLLKKQGKLPFTPPLMSFLSSELKKPSRLITQEEVNEFISKER
jgi:hypothetical protein